MLSVDNCRQSVNVSIGRVLRVTKHYYGFLCGRKGEKVGKHCCTQTYYTDISLIWLVVPCILVLIMKWITNLMQLNIYLLLSSFSSTCFGLTRPSSGAIGVTILTNVTYGVLGFCLVRCLSWGVCVLLACCSATRQQHQVGNLFRN